MESRGFFHLSSKQVPKIKKRSVTINPGMLCQPIGAMQAVLGVHAAIPLVHGSQGCAAYPMRMSNRHYAEPAEIALSSLGEDAAIFGEQIILLRVCMLLQHEGILN
ncbi:hypothetical protein DRN76_04765 [Methanosarcinales archaeon]|nr:MAG: hypothetical protein DRN76_04765 [Methanosarcinales archaeon]